MKKIIFAVALAVASVGVAAEFFLASLAGTNTQTLTLGAGSTKLALQCTTGVRYRLSQGAAVTVTTNDALIATGDPYIIDRGPDQVFLNVAHQDTTTAIDCKVYRRSP